MAILANAGLAAAQRPPDRARYLATAAPLRTGPRAASLCVAISPYRSDNVWWWQPGRHGCHDRSTGPGVFHLPAQVYTSVAGVTSVHFRLPLMGPPMTADSAMDVRLELRGDTLRSPPSGAWVFVERRADLAVPGVYLNMP